MFKTYLSKNSYTGTDMRAKAYELASLLPGRCSVRVDSEGNYYVWDGYVLFDVKNEMYAYDIKGEDTVQDVAYSDVKTHPMQTVSLRRFAITIGSRKVIPIYNLSNGTISMLGVSFDDLGGLVKIVDSGRTRIFSYGLRGSMLYFEEA